MNLYSKLRQRQAEGRPLRIGLIGAGEFGSMWLAQIPESACRHLARVGWDPQRVQATSLDAAVKAGTIHVTDDWRRWYRTRPSTSSSSAPVTHGARVLRPMSKGDCISWADVAVNTGTRARRVR